MNGELREPAREARAAIRTVVRMAHPCNGGHHSKAGHSDMACFRCRGTMISQRGLEFIEAIEAELEEALNG